MAREDPKDEDLHVLCFARLQVFLELILHSFEVLHLGVVSHFVYLARPAVIDLFEVFDHLFDCFAVLFDSFAQVVHGLHDFSFCVFLPDPMEITLRVLNQYC